ELADRREALGPEEPVAAALELCAAAQRGVRERSVHVREELGARLASLACGSLRAPASLASSLGTALARRRQVRGRRARNRRRRLEHERRAERFARELEREHGLGRAREVVARR